ncbi:MAG: hypothetical protein IPK35_00395 [Saprospiraceae bacterium]|nr:hypothetical protein [Saprospiraceae bacterium]
MISNQVNSIDIRIQLAFMWTSLMFCYIYCDYFELYTPDKISEIIEGTSMLNDPWKLFAASVLLAIPSMMIYLSISLPPKINRLLNIGFGVFFALFLALILTSLDFEWYKFYMMFAAIEIVLAALIARKAYLWPQTES